MGKGKQRGFLHNLELLAVDVAQSADYTHICYSLLLPVNNAGAFLGRNTGRKLSHFAQNSTDALAGFFSEGF